MFLIGSVVKKEKNVNINNTQSPSFQAIYIMRNLSKKQMKVAEKISDILCYSDEFVKAEERGVDVYFTKPKTKQGLINVAYVDTFTDMQFRLKNGKILTTESNANYKPTKKDYFNLTDRIRKVLASINEGKYDSSLEDMIHFVKDPTDGQKLRTL